MKVIPWILVIVLAGGCFFLYSKSARNEALIVELQQKLEDKEGNSTPAGNDEGNLSADELDRLRKEAAEVYKLRGEIAQLRRDNQRMKEQMQHLAIDDPSLQGAGTNDPFFEEFPPLTPAEEEAQELELKHAIACVEHLKTLEDAKTKWATTNNKNGGDAAPMNEVMPFVPDQTMPVCPSGGTYVFNEVGVPASCSVEGHSLLP